MTGASAGTAAWRRLAALPYAPVMAAALLGMLAVAQALWIAVAGAPHGGRTLSGGAAAAWWLTLLVLALVSLANTVPLGFLWARPAWAAVIMSAASVVSLAGFQMLTVAGLVAQLAGAYRLGRRGSPLLAAALSLPFLILALAASPRFRGQGPGPAAGLARPGGRAGRERAPGPARRDRAQRGAGGYRGHPAGAHRARGAGPDLPRAARRGRASHLHDRGAGGDGPAHHPGDVRGRGAAAARRSGTPRGPR